jgi:hypothetical protein
MFLASKKLFLGKGGSWKTKQYSGESPYNRFYSCRAEVQLGLITQSSLGSIPKHGFNLMQEEMMFEVNNDLSLLQLFFESFTLPLSWSSFVSLVYLKAAIFYSSVVGFYYYSQYNISYFMSFLQS